MCSFNAISHRNTRLIFFSFDTIVQNIFKNIITVYNLQMYLDWLAVVVNSGLINTTMDCKSGENAHQFANVHQFGLNFIGKDEVFHGLLYYISQAGLRRK